MTLTLEQVFEEMELLEQQYPWFGKTADEKIAQGMVTFSEPDDFLSVFLTANNNEK